MAESSVEINWGAAGTAEVVAAARRAMKVNGRPVVQDADVGAKAAIPSPGAVLTKIKSKPLRLKSLRKAGSAAGKPAVYALMTLAIMAAGVAGVWKANAAFAPEMYDPQGMVPAAEAHAAGRNYAVFDLNLNIRRWREEAVARFSSTPDVVVLGASHWQEAHSGLIRSERMYNGHVHRDYWEDLLGVVEVYVRNNRLPKRMIIAVRDKQFTPLSARKDYLWEPGIPNYRRMADRLGITKEDAWKTYPYQRMRERLSLTMLFNNVTRWFNAVERPHASVERNFAHLDTLLPDGSILWSADHMKIFTPERARSEALSFAASSRASPPEIDKKGVEAFDKLLAFLKAKGVQVVLVHPPFNPIFYDAVRDTKYMTGLDKVRKLTIAMAAKYDLQIIGEFDPAKVGCTSDQYIDAEHANPACLQKIFDEYEALLPLLKLESTKVQS